MNLLNIILIFFHYPQSSSASKQYSAFTMVFSKRYGNNKNLKIFGHIYVFPNEFFFKQKICWKQHMNIKKEQNSIIFFELLNLHSNNKKIKPQQSIIQPQFVLAKKSKID
jgi:hypothetical protein